MELRALASSYMNIVALNSKTNLLAISHSFLLSWKPNSSNKLAICVNISLLSISYLYIWITFLSVLESNLEIGGTKDTASKWCHWSYAKVMDRVTSPASRLLWVSSKLGLLFSTKSLYLITWFYLLFTGYTRGSLGRIIEFIHKSPEIRSAKSLFLPSIPTLTSICYSLGCLSMKIFWNCIC
jgi:hypothetical protein